jgi:serine/threonine protein kinase/tetratricopeptide (TPR) repeat protein
LGTGEWSRIEDLFHQAAELAPAERPAFLDKVCDGGEELRREVESLLAADTPEDERFQVAVDRAVDQLPATSDEGGDLIGKSIGRYSITGLIGKGGMGAVYRAVREDDFRMQVAIKLLKRGTDTEAALKRFRIERQILAGLQHPNIAHLIDGGATETGLPYFVMEYVEGTPLLEYAAPLPVRQRLELFRVVCSAVQYAHEKLIVHRDIKPGNILVSPEGIPKLLDFGIAKLLDPAADGATATAGMRLMTPDYASPEQVQGEPVTTATDVYSLGAVLYELLTDQRAHHVERKKPSMVAKHLDPDLDNIVLMALRKEPERRYGSVQEFSDDIDRFLQDLPVRARKENLLYRGRKFLKRSRALILAGTIGAVIILAILTGLSRISKPNASRSTDAAPRSIAVLPLENLSHDPQQEPFVDGMTDALIGDLGKIRSLRVIARDSVMRYKGAHKPATSTARELNANALVEGSVLRSGDRVRVSVQVRAGAMDRVLWSQTYDRDLQDMPALQSDAARAIAREIQIPLTPQEEARLSPSRAVNRQAYEAYFKGRYQWYKFNDEGWNKSIQYFKQAVDIDPAYALAWAGLADGYYGVSDQTLPPREAMPLARAAALRALALDENLAEAHASLAIIQAQYDWDWASAEKSFRRALELNPSYAYGHRYYSWYLAEMGRLDQAISEAQEAYRLDPLPPLIGTHLGWIYSLARRPDQAIAQLHKVLEIDSSAAVTHWSLGAAYEQKGMVDQAIAEYLKVQAMPHLAHIHAVTGKREQARRELAKLLEGSRQHYIDPYVIAGIYVGLGETDKAFEWFEKAYEERSEEILFLKVDPVLDSIHADPRYQSLLRRIGLPP